MSKAYDISNNVDIAGVIEEFERKLQEKTYFHLGYPYNLQYDFGELNALQKYSINNLGDPFIDSNYAVHSREFEIAVLDWFARLWKIDKYDYWGYVTNCGTEGNLYGILLGRENFPDGVLYASSDSHYSVFKAGRMFRMPIEKVKSLENGEMDYGDFEKALRKNVGFPAIVNVNIGTTVRGAVDNIDRVIECLKSCGYEEDRFFIHCDGALFGMMLPFVKGVEEGKSVPQVSFDKPIGSISVSGHKFVGSPIPCGVVLTRKRYTIALSSCVEYINSRDTTIMGSRNGHTPIYMWYTLCKKSIEDITDDVRKCIHNAHFLKGRFEERGIDCMLNDLSSTVVFRRPREEVVKKWQLACEGDYAHIVVMPNVSKEKLEEFLLDYFCENKYTPTTE